MPLLTVLNNGLYLLTAYLPETKYLGWHLSTPGQTTGKNQINNRSQYNCSRCHGRLYTFCPVGRARWMAYSYLAAAVINIMRYTFSSSPDIPYCVVAAKQIYRKTKNGNNNKSSFFRWMRYALFLSCKSPI